jgi:serine/threonine protein kinase
VTTIGFRASLDAWRNGKATQDDVEEALRRELQADPGLTSATRALIEAYRRAGHVPLPLAERLLSLGQTLSESAASKIESGAAPVVGRERPLPSTTANPATLDPAVPYVEATKSGPLKLDPNRTILRPSPAVADKPAPALRAAPEQPSDRTKLRPPPAFHADIAATANPPELKTQFRIAPQAPPVATPAAAGVLQPNEESVGSQSGPDGFGKGTSLPSWPVSSATGGHTGANSSLTIGSVLSGQYVLESIVPGGDKGGMGIVFRARDLIQEEAQDRNPYVAVKILNEQFKQHPESMKALNREYKKALRLSHPNIVKVQNFSRDASNVFMVMELLEGQSLGEAIHAVKGRGLPVPEALRVTLALARALAYAHQMSIVHSDFKPSNAFITHDGAVKVLDFGIARAAKVRGGPLGGKDDGTLFDAGTLGAYTLPYASCEQINGEEPDPRDDVYALAVVSYQLFTGRHPFDRKDAATARDAGMKPQPVAGLSRRQWSALQSALSFARDKRPADAQAFGDGMTPKQWPVRLLVISGVAVLLVLVAATWLTTNLLERRQYAGIAKQLASADPTVAGEAVQRLLSADIATRAAILSEEGTANAVLSWVKNQVRAAFDPPLQRYDFPTAIKIVETAQSLLRDSASLLQFRESLETQQKQQLNLLGEQFEHLLAAHALLGQGGEPSLLSARQRIMRLDPQHPLLNDNRVPIAFRDAAEGALAQSDPDKAETLIKAGLQLAPDDPGLSDLTDSVRHERDKIRLANSIGDWEHAIAPLAESDAGLVEFRSARDAMGHLRAAAPEDRVLARAERRLEALLDGDITTALRQQNAGQAQAILGEFQAQLAPQFLKSKQTAIAEVIGEARARQLQAEQLRRDIDLLLTAPRAEDVWVADLSAVLSKLTAIVPKDAKIADAQVRGGRYLIDQARTLRAASRFGEAERLLDGAATFGVSPNDIRVELDAVHHARDQMQIDNRNKALEAKIAADKQRVLDLAGAGGGRLDQAYDLYMQLVKQLPAADQWGTTDAPRALGDGFLRRAQPLADQGKFQLAQAQAHKLSSLPLKDAYYSGRIEFFDRLLALQTTLQTGPIATAAPLVESLKHGDARAYANLEPQFVNIVNERLRRIPASLKDQAKSMQEDAKTLFPTQKFVQSHD